MARVELISDADATASGDVKAVLRSPWFVVAEVDYPGGFEDKRLVHHKRSLSFVVRGSFVECIDDQQLVVDQDCIIFNDAFEPHTNRYDRDCRVIVVEFSPASSELTRLFENQRRARSHQIRPVVLRIREELYRSDAVAPAAICAKLMELAAALWRERMERQTHAPFRRAAMAIHDHPARIDVGDLALATSLPVAAFRRQFRENIGMPVRDYVRHVRIEKAKTLLRDTSTDLRTIACDLGFFDQSHFSNTFKRVVGVTPRAYRRRPV